MKKKTWRLGDGCAATLSEAPLILRLLPLDEDDFGDGAAHEGPLEGAEIGVYVEDGEGLECYFSVDSGEGGVLRATRHPGGPEPGVVEILEDGASLFHVLEPGADPALIPRDARALLFLGPGDLAQLAGMDRLTQLSLIGVEDLNCLPELPALADFSIGDASELESFDGLQRSKKVREVMATLCPRLWDVAALVGLSELSSLTLDRCARNSIIGLTMRFGEGMRITETDPVMWLPSEHPWNKRRA